MQCRRLEGGEPVLTTGKVTKTATCRAEQRRVSSVCKGHPVVSLGFTYSIQENTQGLYSAHRTNWCDDNLFTSTTHTKVKPRPKGSSQAEAVNEVKSPLFIAPLVKSWTQSRGVSTSKKESAQVAVGSFWGSDGSWPLLKKSSSITLHSRSQKETGG